MLPSTFPSRLSPTGRPAGSSVGRIIRIGDAILVPEDWFMREMHLTKTQFRTLIRSLGLPFFIVGENTYYVNLDYFEALIWYVTAPGHGDFHGPGSKARETGSIPKTARKALLDDDWSSIDLDSFTNIIKNARERNHEVSVHRILKRLRRLDRKVANGKHL